MRIALDEQKEEDKMISVDGIDIIFNKKEKLYIHKCTIDREDNRLVVIPWFRGFC